MNEKGSIEFNKFPGYKEDIYNSKSYRILFFMVCILVLILLSLLSSILNYYIIMK